MSTEIRTSGLHHLGLSVPNIAETRDFFVRVLGFKIVGEKPDYPAVFVSDGETLLTLWQITNPQTAACFDRKMVVGLHHFALRLKDANQLDELHCRFIDEPNVDVEFAPEALGEGLARHMMCNIPGGVRMEVIALPAPPKDN